MNWKNKLTEATDSIQEATGNLPGLADLVTGKINEVLDEYKAAAAQLETFGFTVDAFDLKLAPPSAHTSIRGSIANIKVDSVQKVMNESKGNSVLTSTLNALLTAKKIHEQVNLNLDSLILDITLGVPPSVVVRFGTRSVNLTQGI